MKDDDDDDERWMPRGYMKSCSVYASSSVIHHYNAVRGGRAALPESFLSGPPSRFPEKP
jgi:hypothetical protein